MNKSIRPQTGADFQFSCPICGTKWTKEYGGTLKRIGDTDKEGNVEYGCYSCGYIAKFKATFMEEYQRRRLENT